MKYINPDLTRGRIRHALFDFDGTLSLIREGWQDVMIPMMVEILLQTPDARGRGRNRRGGQGVRHRLTGKQTIYQMIQLAEEIAQRGGAPLDPLALQVHVPGPAVGADRGPSGRAEGRAHRRRTT